MSEPNRARGGGSWGNHGFPHVEIARDVRFLDV